MNNKNKILMRILLVILTLTLISTLVLSSVYARYVKKHNSDANTARPAGIAFEAKFDDYVNIEAGYTIDDEPGNPIGHTEARRYYDFEVKTCESEVALNVTTKITFSEKTSARVRQARKDRFAMENTATGEDKEYGISCDYELMLWNPDTSKYELVVQRGKAVDGSGFTISETGLDSSTGVVTVSATSMAAAKQNPDATTSGYAKYRLVIVIYNNTLMSSSGNVSNYFLDSNAMTVNVSATQVDPEFSGIIP